MGTCAVFERGVGGVLKSTCTIIYTPVYGEVLAEASDIYTTFGLLTTDFRPDPMPARVILRNVARHDLPFTCTCLTFMINISTASAIFKVVSDIVDPCSQSPHPATLVIDTTRRIGVSGAQLHKKLYRDTFHGSTCGFFAF